MKTPGPDHPITITLNPKHIRVEVDGQLVADTTHALSLKEASYPAVQYIPRADVKAELLEKTEHTTHCPYKGDASYYSVGAKKNMIWSYETPYPAMQQIAGYMAFYPNQATITES